MLRTLSPRAEPWSAHVEFERVTAQSLVVGCDMCDREAMLPGGDKWR
jgi:hypothetical protein